MAFTAQDVKNLREQTGCGMMDCKKALTESGGDFEKAVEYLREKGLAAAQKKAGRIAAEGMVYATVNGKVGVVVEVNAETDFVAKNEMFQNFVKDIAEVIIEKNPADVDALLACQMGNDTVEAALKEKILVIGENIKIRRFERYEGVCSAYIHAGGTHAVLVAFNTSDEIAAKAEFEAYGKDVAMQIAAANPGYLCESEVPAEVIEKEKEILLAQIANDPKNANKPDAIKEKMVQGRIGKFYKENCLVEQEFVKDPDLNIAQYTEKTAKALGGEIEIVKFARYEKGEGLEKKVDDFAAEVASMTK
ncbi:MAG: translation elongation factor Ts [Candidatus Fournierella pullistercoris]|uniref:Elongation factor Ts n=1 Tax=Candidatus Allofournierella pullistercoris TaxID=2838597 RepID=A0A948WQI9_9FIRM|nr:translation elongation factor Ts [Candidatus Fournierella pullistercoris]